jgi:hypothetical protein
VLIKVYMTKSENKDHPMKNFLKTHSVDYDFIDRATTTPSEQKRFSKSIEGGDFDEAQRLYFIAVNIMREAIIN